MFRDKALSDADLNLLADTVLAFEQEDYPVGPASITGTIARVKFINKRTRFAVFVVNPDESELLIVVTCYCVRHLGPGLRVVAKGSWQYHEEFGAQVAAETMQLSLPVG